MNPWTQLKAEMFPGPCQVYKKGAECGKEAEDLDHAIFSGKQKNKKVRSKERKWRNQRFNAQLACADCNRWTRNADRNTAVLWHIKREISRDVSGFTDWFYNPPPGISTVPGSRHHEITIMVEQILLEMA